PSPIEKTLGVLAPGTSQQVHVTLRATQAGQLCHTVEILGTGGLYATKQICVMAVEAAVSGPATGGAMTEPPDSTPVTPLGQPSISVKKTGPTRANVGEKVLFTTSITNTGTRRLTNIQVTDRYPPGLVPLNAAVDHTYDDQKNQFTWTLDSLEPGETAAELRVECHCSSTADQACNRVTVTAQEGVESEDEVCLQIVGRPGGDMPGGLTLTVASTRDPIGVGQVLGYEIDVTNGGLTADRQIAVTVTLPIGMTVVELGTTGPGVKRTVEGQTIRFDPVAELAAEQTLNYRIRVHAQQVGDMTLRAQVTSENRPQGIQAEEHTTVF
ncbi:MAG TPA: hypothetical protein VE890_04755, partial [Thermoguttaceae bacterium]|nr:hypothetical protein [Thermoguttaceae bacterium]